MAPDAPRLPASPRPHRGRGLLAGVGLSLLLLSPLLASGDSDPPPEGFSEDRSCSDTGCHEKEVSYRNLHPAMEEGCDVCHMEGDEPHTFEDGDFDPDMCLDCHDDGDDRTWDHAEGSAECIDCHDPHGTNRRSLLLMPLTELCQDCHELAVDPDYASNHEPVSRGECLECHHPHDPTAEPLLKRPINETCVQCHRSLVEPRGMEPGVHIGLEEGNGCPICHEPHESENRRLLKLPYSNQAHTEDLEKSAKLCFSCHELESLKDGEQTLFRSGEGASLHAVHFEAPGLVRSCAACHRPHLPGQRALLGGGFMMGKWRAPMGYSLEDSLATCLPACHEPRTYPATPR